MNECGKRVHCSLQYIRLTITWVHGYMGIPFSLLSLLLALLLLLLLQMTFDIAFDRASSHTPSYPVMPRHAPVRGPADSNGNY